MNIILIKLAILITITILLNSISKQKESFHHSGYIGNIRQPFIYMYPNCMDTLLAGTQCFKPLFPYYFF